MNTIIVCPNCMKGFEIEGKVILNSQEKKDGDPLYGNHLEPRSKGGEGKLVESKPLDTDTHPGVLSTQCEHKDRVVATLNNELKCLTCGERIDKVAEDTQDVMECKSCGCGSFRISNKIATCFECGKECNNDRNCEHDLKDIVDFTGRDLFSCIKCEKVFEGVPQNKSEQGEHQ